MKDEKDAYPKLAILPSSVKGCSFLSIYSSAGEFTHLELLKNYEIKKKIIKELSNYDNSDSKTIDWIVSKEWLPI